MVSQAGAASIAGAAAAGAGLGANILTAAGLAGVGVATGLVGDDDDIAADTTLPLPGISSDFIAGGDVFFSDAYFAWSTVDIDSDGQLEFLYAGTDTSGNSRILTYETLEEFIVDINATTGPTFSGQGNVHHVVGTQISSAGSSEPALIVATDIGTTMVNLSDGTSTALANVPTTVFNADVVGGGTAGYFSTTGSTVVYQDDAGNVITQFDLDNAYSYDVQDKMGHADVTGDGVSDVWVWDKSENTFWIYANSGSDAQPAFAFSQEPTDNASQFDVTGTFGGVPTELQVFDIDGDGDADIIIGSAASNTVLAYEFIVG